MATYPKPAISVEPEIPRTNQLRHLEGNALKLAVSARKGTNRQEAMDENSEEENP